MSAKPAGPHTLAVDVGGTGIKAAVLDKDGAMQGDHQRIATPHPCPPQAMLEVVSRLIAKLPEFDRISVGFPGAVRAGRVLTAPNLGTQPWRHFDLVHALSDHFGKPARVLNDAEVQGLGIIEGHGLEVVLTLGTGIGSAVFSEGRLTPHLELGQHPITKRRSYDHYIGDVERRRIGASRWNQRVAKVLAIAETLFNFDTLYLGGGNAQRLKIDLPENVQLASNAAGITGGIRLWDDHIWDAVPSTHQPG